MIAEAIKELGALFKRSNDLQIVHDDRTRCSFVRTADKVERVPFIPVPRKASIPSLDDLIAIIMDVGVCPAPEVYVSEGSITVLVNGADRHEAMTMRLDLSHQFRMLLAMKEPRTMTAPSLIDLLRFDLPCSVSSSLISKLRKVNFAQARTGSAETAHGKEGFGRSIEAQIQGTHEIPEEIDVTVPIYTNPGVVSLSTVTVKCGIKIVPQEEGFVIRPLADQVTIAVNKAVQVIRNHIADAVGEHQVLVVMGTP